MNCTKPGQRKTQTADRRPQTEGKIQTKTAEQG